MSLVFNGKYDGFATGAGGWGLKDVEISLVVPEDLSGQDPGKVYYIKQDDTLIMEVPTEPYHQVLAGGILGWAYDFNVLSGTDTIELSNNRFIIFSTIKLNEDEGYNNVDVYKNGMIMENSLTGDYIIEKDGDDYKLVFNYDVDENDRIILVVSSRPSMNNYVTKLALKDYLQNVDLDIIPTENDVYNIGSEANIFNSIRVHRVVGPNGDNLIIKGNVQLDGDLVVGGSEHTTTNTNITDESLVIHYSDPGVDGNASLDIRRFPRVEGDKEKTEVTLKADQSGNLDGTYWTVSSALDEETYAIWYRVTPDEARIEGTSNLTLGHDWINYEDSFDIIINSINYTIDLEQSHSDVSSLIGEINDKFSNLGISAIAIEGGASSFYIVTNDTGSSKSIQAVDSTALTKLGLPPTTTFYGVDGEYSYEEVNLDGSLLDDSVESGLLPGQTYDFSISIGSNTQNVSIHFIEQSRASVLGDEDLSLGYNWSASQQDFLISVNGGGVETVSLSEQSTDIATTVSLINSRFLNLGLTEIEAYNDGNFIGIRTLNNGSDQSIIIESGTNDALATLGLVSGSYSGTDDENTSYSNVITKLNEETANISWSIVSGNIRAQNESPDNNAIQIANGTTLDLFTSLNDIQTPNFINSTLGVVPQPAKIENTIDLSSDIDFANHNEQLIIDSTIYNLDQKTTSISEIVTYLNTLLPSNLEVYDSDSNIGIKTSGVGHNESINVGAGSANMTLGFTTGDYFGVGHIDISEIEPIDVGNNIMIEITRGDNANTIASLTYDELSLISSFNVSILGATLTIENVDIGTAVDVSDYGTDISINVTTQGSATFFPGDRDAKILWDDTDHIWKLKYGQEGENHSAIVTEDHNSAYAAQRLSNNPLLSLSGGLSGSININGQTDVTLNATVLDDSHDHATNISGSASKITTPRVINLIDDVQGSISFDGSTDVSIPTTTKAIDGVAVHADTIAPTGTTRINTEGYFYATRVYNAVYNDLAEFMYKAEDAEPGDVMIQTSNGLIKSQKHGDARVVGVYSDTYGYALGAEEEDKKIPIGISGTVFVKIDGKFKIGDMVIASKNGKARKANFLEKFFNRDALVGKILQDNTKESGRVKILII